MSEYVLEQSDRPPRDSVIGCGGCSTIYLSNDPTGKGKFVIKQFDQGQFDQTQLMQEAEALVKLNHPCIVRIRNFILPSEREPAEIHMEYASNGSLARVLNLVRRGSKPSFWTPTGIGIIICGIILGMRFMHWQGFIHQDLKPSNILLDVDGRTLLSDFGTSRCQAVDRTPTVDTGTPHYAAPELFDEVVRDDKVDVFSFGLILYEIVVGSAVFPHDMLSFEIIRQHRRGNRSIIPEFVDPVIKTLIEVCWSRDPSKRPSFNEILDCIESNGFRIVPGADSDTIRFYVVGVRDWEQMRDFKNPPSESQ
jgi:serine/threonine protein kinase